MISSMTTVVAVPARLQSSRLPNKVLADIGGRPMLQRVLEGCAQAAMPKAVVLCTDCTNLAGLANSWGLMLCLPAQHVSPEVNGSLRWLLS